MSEFINGISYVFYHNSYLKYYLFLIILMRIKRNSIDKILLSLILHFFHVFLSCSDLANWDGFGVEWVDQWVNWSS
jgi:hypothetical protein